MTSQIISGQITATGSPVVINVPLEFDGIMVFNRTNQSSTATPAVVKQSKWFSGMAQASAYVLKNTAGAATDESSIITTGGFSIIDDASPVNGAVFALGAPFFTQASQAVFTTSSPHGFIVGDIVRIYGLTGARQYGGLDLSVIAVGSSTTFTTYLNTTGITVATAGFVQKLGLDESIYYPKNRFIAAMTSSGTNTVITTTVAHGYQVGQKVTFKVPSVTTSPVSFGFSQMTDQVGLITAINSAVGTNTFTVSIDSSSYGTFAYPATTAVPFTFATVIPYSDGQPNPLPIPAPDQNVLVGATDNRGQKGIVLGSSVCGAADDVLDYFAFSSAQLINI